MGTTPVGSGGSVEQGVIRVLDEARKLDPRDGDYVEFRATGAAAKGVYRCSGCGYGVTVTASLPRCPMCGGATWEAAGAGTYARRGESLQ